MKKRKKRRERRSKRRKKRGKEKQSNRRKERETERADCLAVPSNQTAKQTGGIGGGVTPRTSPKGVAKHPGPKPKPQQGWGPFPSRPKSGKDRKAPHFQVGFEPGVVMQTLRGGTGRPEGSEGAATTALPKRNTMSPDLSDQKKVPLI